MNVSLFGRELPDAWVSEPLSVGSVDGVICKSASILELGRCVSLDVLTSMDRVVEWVV